MESVTLKSAWHGAVHATGGLCKAAWDKAVLNSQRLERGMEKAQPHWSTAPHAIVLAVIGKFLYNDGGCPEVIGVTAILAALSLVLTRLQSRAEIDRFDEIKKEEYTAAAITFYESHKDKAAPDARPS